MRSLGLGMTLLASLVVVPTACMFRQTEFEVDTELDMQTIENYPGAIDSKTGELSCNSVCWLGLRELRGSRAIKRLDSCSFERRGDDVVHIRCSGADAKLME